MWTAHADPGQGFSVAAPDAWDFILHDSASLAADLDAVGKHSPELQAFFKKSTDADPELRFLAADPRSLAQGFAANINVTSSDLGSASSAPSLDELARAKLTRLDHEAAVVQPVKRADHRLGGYPAARFEYSLKAGDQVVTVQSYIVVVPRGGRRARLELTMGAAGDQATSVFDTVAQSFTITQV